MSGLPEKLARHAEIEWSSGMTEGKTTNEHGSVYYGNWKNHTMEGEGVYTYADSSKYVGNFVAGHPHGHGVKTAANGDTYSGNWESGEMTGPGTRTTSEGVAQTVIKENGLPEKLARHAEIEWSSGMTEGKMTNDDGSVYYGEFKNDEMDGLGVYTFASGARCLGEFKEDAFCGK
eukprot:gene24105-30408_t